jgi:DUF4097 and DUF4098 domain-containing protein YvlB
MKAVFQKGSRMIMPAAAALLLAAGASSAPSDLVKSYDLPKGKKIVFDLEDGGSIHVSGWDEAKVEITFSDKHKDIEDYDIRVDETKFGLKINAALAHRKDHYTNLRVDVRAPKQVDIEFRTAGGAISLSGVEGAFSGKTMGGSISIEDVKGDLNIETMGGEIEVLDSEVDGKVHTMGGPVLVKNVVGDLRAASNGGNVQYLNVRRKSGDVRSLRETNRGDRELTRETVQISSMGGSIDVKEAPDGAIVQTGGGEIDIQNADRFVDAQTGGGDISIHTESGWVKATTGAGDIDVVIRSDTKDEGDVSLITGTGDVTITLPAGFSMELDVDLGYTRNSDRDYRILSDFEIDEEHTDKWDSSQGTPRKHIYGTATLAGGKHKIRIRTVNGDVRIRKLK